VNAQLVCIRSGAVTVLLRRASLLLNVSVTIAAYRAVCPHPNVVVGDGATEYPTGYVLTNYW